MHIAMIGTRGVPARYGGFETCIDEVGARLAEEGHRVTVYCRRSDGPSPATYRGMRLVTLPAVRHRALETLSHTGLSAAHAVAGSAPEVAFVFNAANAPWLPVLRARRIPVATHVDGLEWKRGKWGPRAQQYYRAAEALSVRWSDALIADAQGIADYYRDEFGADTRLITYGAPRVTATGKGLEALGLRPSSFHLAVARFEPENHVQEIVEGYTRSAARLPLVVVGHAPYGEAYIARVKQAADDRVRFLGSLWDQDLLDQLYANALVYWHGHSVGGTNPSLLRAIGAGAAVNAFDVSFNREVLRAAGRFWTSPRDVGVQVLEAESGEDDVAARGRAASAEAERYDWDDVAQGYLRLAEDLVSRRRRSTRLASGRRTSVPAP